MLKQSWAFLRRALHEAVRVDTPEEARMADIDAQDADRDVFEPPVRPAMKRAYERGWYGAHPV